MAKDPIFLRKRFCRYVMSHWKMNNHNLKNISCVYVMISLNPTEKDCDIVYIGSTTKLFLRYKSHKVPKKIQDTGLLNLLYYHPMKKGFYDYEIKLINKLNPIFNKQHKNG